jgi:hypothetical protein
MLTFQSSFKECEYTKGDVLHELDFTRPEQLDSNQIMATIIIIKNTNKTQQFINTWYETMRKNNYSMCDDTPSIVSNHNKFIDHRHDQSVFSVLVKKNKIQYIPDETFNNPKSPIQATRIKY